MGFSVDATREEALLVFNKWLAENRLLRCDFSFRAFAASLRGHLISVSDETVSLLSADRTSELVLALDSVVRFGYGEPKSSADGGNDFVSGLVLFLTPPSPDEDDDFLGISEFVES